jgi:hypothetical protein
LLGEGEEEEEEKEGEEVDDFYLEAGEIKIS